jgi:hypothetical protein
VTSRSLHCALRPPPSRRTKEQVEEDLEEVKRDIREGHFKDAHEWCAVPCSTVPCSLGFVVVLW